MATDRAPLPGSQVDSEDVGGNGHWLRGGEPLRRTARSKHLGVKTTPLRHPSCWPLAPILARLLTGQPPRSEGISRGDACSLAVPEVWAAPRCCPLAAQGQYQL